MIILYWYEIRYLLWATVTELWRWYFRSYVRYGISIKKHTQTESTVFISLGVVEPDLWFESLLLSEISQSSARATSITTSPVIPVTWRELKVAEMTCRPAYFGVTSVTSTKFSPASTSLKDGKNVDVYFVSLHVWRADICFVEPEFETSVAARDWTVKTNDDVSELHVERIVKLHF